MPLDLGLLALVHVLLLVYWLGGDLGVFYCAGFLIKPELPVATRLTVMKILHFLDQAPRICLVLILPVGTTLGLRAGYLRFDPILLLPLWIFAAVWLWMVLVLATKARTKLGRYVAKLDLAMRFVVITALLFVALRSLAGDGPATGSNWLAAKLIVYALLIVNGLMIRLTFRPFGPAFGALIQTGSSPDVEATLRRTVHRVRPVVLTLWCLLLVEAYLGLAKPF
ncbi:hypothetical protein [Roseiterribacter gracilis]|uniref:Uncharacterized protein n=1 Tax=Roseiterribacter gracilis TaxID=2812848 RepID=A0A8S8XGG9_9PROT|nr:hypothetical protein TMPK1_24570 [Rhodospirillales bacterium TMPK1]